MLHRVPALILQPERAGDGLWSGLLNGGAS